MIKDDILVPEQAYISNSHSGDVEKDEILENHKFSTNPAEVRVEIGMTVNLGNYESAKITVALSTPCHKEDVDRCYNESLKWVKERAKKEVRSAKKLVANRELPF